MKIFKITLCYLGDEGDLDLYFTNLPSLNQLNNAIVNRPGSYHSAKTALLENDHIVKQIEEILVNFHSDKVFETKPLYSIGSNCTLGRMDVQAIPVIEV